MPRPHCAWQALGRLICIARATELRPVVFSDQVRQLADGGRVGGHHRHRMWQAGPDVRIDADLHAEVALHAFPDLVNFGGALRGLILPRGAPQAG